MSIQMILISLLLAGGGDSTSTSFLPAGWDMHFQSLVHAGAMGGWVESKPVMDSTFFDASLSVKAVSPNVDILASVAAGLPEDSILALRRGRFALKWPGTPWIGASAHINDRQPFVPGLGNAISEWGWADSTRGFGVSGGGILGFRSDYLYQLSSGDTLQQLNIFSPWMGFAGFDYRRIQLNPQDSSSSGEWAINTFSIRSDLRYASPWLVIVGGDGRRGVWAFTGEIRDFRPISTEWGSIEVVPSMSFAGDSLELPSDAFVPGQRVLALAAYLQSRRYMVSAGLQGRVDLESDSLSGVSAMAGMVSRNGVLWNLNLDLSADGDYYGELSAGTYDRMAGAGLMLHAEDDSIRVTGSASYTPRNDVCAEVSVSGDLDDSLQPSCGAYVSAAAGPVRGLISVDWEYNSSPVFRIDLRGLLR